MLRKTQFVRSIATMLRELTTHTHSQHRIITLYVPMLRSQIVLPVEQYETNLISSYFVILLVRFPFIAQSMTLHYQYTYHLLNLIFYPGLYRTLLGSSHLFFVIKTL